MKSVFGFSILEFMIALCIGTTICTSILLSYSETFKTYLYNTNLLTQNHDLSLAMQVIKNDASKAGIFGVFNLHYQDASLYQINSSSTPLCGNNKICGLTTDSIGIMSNVSDIDNIGNGFKLASNSDILKLQFGTNDVKLITTDKGISCQWSHSCLIDKCNDEYYLNNLYFTNGNLNKSSAIYMLSSANHAYLLKFDEVNEIQFDDNKFNLKLTINGCPKDVVHDIKLAHVSEPKGYISSFGGFDPDIYTMNLSNFNTVYYFVGYGIDNNESGLYRVYLENSGSMSKPELVSSKISQMKIDYILSVTTLDHDSNNAHEFTICSTSDMISNDNRCGGYWNKVIAAKITLMSNDNGITYQNIATVSW